MMNSFVLLEARFYNDLEVIGIIAAIVAAVILLRKLKNAIQDFFANLPRRMQLRRENKVMAILARSSNSSQLPRDPHLLRNVIMDQKLTDRQHFLILERLHELGSCSNEETHHFIESFANGVGTSKSIHTAKFYARTLVSKGDNWAKLKLARLLLDNNPDEKQKQEAYRYLQSLYSNDGDPQLALIPKVPYAADAAWELGKMLVNGYMGSEGVETGYLYILQAALTNHEKAISFYQHPDEATLTRHHDQATDMRIFAASYINKERLLNLALPYARYGDPYCCHYAGLYYYNKPCEKNDKRAFLLLRLAAALGYNESNLYLSTLYYNGRGTEKDTYLGEQLTMQAAEAGHRIAMHNMGIILDDRERYEYAFEWYKKAAEAGYAPAAVELEKYYRFGRGTERDEEQADYWKQRAEELDHPQKSES